MELIIIIIISIILAIISKFALQINLAKVKNIGMEEELNKLAEKYPSNIEICKYILKKLKNENVLIEEDNSSNTTLYIAITNKILIADTKNSYTRIQTMAHECLHSIQDRRLLMFNFIFSNIYILYFIVITLLTIFKIIVNPMLYLTIFLLLSITYYMIRVFLENDAMFKAKYLAKEYMEEQNVLSNQEVQKIVDGFSRLNDAGIKVVNYQLFVQILIKVIIFATVALIF